MLGYIQFQEGFLKQIKANFGFLEQVYSWPDVVEPEIEMATLDLTLNPAVVFCLITQNILRQTIP